MKALLVSTLVVALLAGASHAQEQSRASMATDPTATQWSLQGAVQWNDYEGGEIAPGVNRPKGQKFFGQFRLVAPIPKESSPLPFTLLPRLTVRYGKNQQGSWGFAQTEIFALGIVNDWGTGRWGLGPIVTIPAERGHGSTDWGFGLAGALVQRALDDQLFYGVLLRQIWEDPTVSAGTTFSGDIEGDEFVVENSGAGPLSIQPILQWTFPGGWYLSNGEMGVSYDWDSQEWYMDLPVRFGKVIVQPKRSWNIYIEYKTAVIYKDWLGSAIDNSVRLNVSLSIPIFQ